MATATAPAPQKQQHESQQSQRTVRIPPGRGIKVEEAITINLKPQEIYQFWRNFENLPRFMYNLDSVRTLDANRSHWVARGPLGVRFEWDAEVMTDYPNEVIGWQSLEGSSVDTAGSVHFSPAPGGSGTEVHVSLQYVPPAGKVGAALAELIGQAPEHEIREDLRRLKRMLETGEIPTTQGQPHGRRVSPTWQATGKALGWFGIGLGLAEILMPDTLGELVGLPEGHRNLLPFFGLREIASGLGILSQRRPASWLWSRVAGDGMDMAFLASALLCKRAQTDRVMTALMAVAGVTALDVLCSQKMTLLPDMPA